MTVLVASELHLGDTHFMVSADTGEHEGVQHYMMTVTMTKYVQTLDEALHWMNMQKRNLSVAGEFHELDADELDELDE